MMMRTDLTKINYYLIIKRLLSKVYILQLSIESESESLHTAIFPCSMIEEAYFELFSLIRDRNKSFNQEAYLHIPKDWYDNDYKELINIFNSDHKDKKLNRDGIILINNPLFYLKVIVKIV